MTEDGFRRWLLISGPIGRVILAIARPFHKLYSEACADAFDRGCLAGGGSLPLEPSGDSAECATDCTVASELEH